MRSGGAKAKGSAFERKVGTALSKWLTRGERPDLFSRNVLSGGKYTVAAKKGQITGMPGDLIAAHPLAFDFLELFMVECKHHKDLNLAQYIFDARNSHLGKIVRVAENQAKEKGLRYLIIAKQNRRAEFVFCDSVTGKVILDSGFSNQFSYHSLHADKVFLAELDHFLQIDPDEFIVNLRKCGPGEKPCTKPSLVASLTS